MELLTYSNGVGATLNLDAPAPPVLFDTVIHWL